MGHMAQEHLRQLPSVDSILQELNKHEHSQQISSTILTALCRTVIDGYREMILSEKPLPKGTLVDQIMIDVQQQIDPLSKPHFRKAVNAAGIVLHTGLGRAVLAPAAMAQLQNEIAGYSVLQVDVKDGKRSSRDGHIETLLKLLTGAEAATIVNNNAAATALVLNTIAAGKEVIVSRGQLVEIGGAFRLPDVMAFSGAKLVEVGTTNKTHLRDYENAITEETAAILRVHPSNYKIQGFTSEVPLIELAELAHANDLVMFDDVGAGSLIDFSKYGFEKEPTLAESIADGADVVSSSGDKLIGASQAGIILGKSNIIKKIRKNQFARIVRADKMTLAVLEATLRLFLNEETAKQDVPTIKMLLRPYESIQRQAARIVTKLRKSKLACEVKAIDGHSQTGSGSLPTQNMPTRLVTISSDAINSDTLAGRLRQHEVPIFTRIQDEKVLIDPRTLLDGDEKIIIDALIEILDANP